MRKENLIKGTLLGLGVVGVMFVNSTSAYNSPEVLENGDLKICSTTDASECITIQGKNVGATTTGAWTQAPTTSYGDYYQWGNNYGFSSDKNSSVTTSDQQIDCSSYGPSNPFSSSTFIISPNWDFYDYCSARNNNLWGGGSDNNGLVYPVENASERRGPCDAGYHVPSKGEWYALMDMWAGSSVNGYNSGNVQKFAEDFQIPFAGSRSYLDGSVYDQGSYAFLWSSNVGGENAWYFCMYWYAAYVDSYDRAIGFPVRCFKDHISFQVTIYDVTGDDKVELWSGKVESGQTVELPDLNLSKPNSYLVFDKWYTDPELTQEFDFNTPITEDLELYAGYKESETWIDWSGNPFSWGEDITICDPENSGACITMMDRNLGATTAGHLECVEPLSCSVRWRENYYSSYDSCIESVSIYGWQEEGFPSVQSCNDDFGEYYCSNAIFARYGYQSAEEMCGTGNFYGFSSYEECQQENERITSEYNECMRDKEQIYGYGFQWGNNHGFNLFSSSTMVSCSKAPWDNSYNNYGYNGNLYIGYQCNHYSHRDYREDDNHYDGLRGGSGDLIENNRGYDKENNVATNVENRQGPCPDGYHVPSAGEWNTVLDYWIKENKNPENVIINDDGLIGGYCEGYNRYCYKDVEVEPGYFEPLNVSCDGDYDGYREVCNNDEALISEFQEDFKLSFAHEGSLQIGYSEGARIQLLSSSPIANTSEFINLSIQKGDRKIYMGRRPRIGVGAVRCFKNTPEINTQNEGGNDDTGGNNGNGGNHGVNHGVGSTISKDNCPNGDFSDSYYDGTCGTAQSSGTEGEGSIGDNKDSSSQSSSEGQENNELQIAYEFAYQNKITTMDTIEKADMEGSLTRIAMAKMLSKYAINVLGKKPTNKIVPKFSDITEELNAEYDDGVTLAYQLGIMGINMPENKFRPFDLVTRAEFGTALSRLIFGIADGEEVYYTTHLAKLKAEGIITNDDPTLEELRGYVMLMLMRSASK